MYILSPCTHSIALSLRLPPCLSSLSLVRNGESKARTVQLLSSIRIHMFLSSNLVSAMTNSWKVKRECVYVFNNIKDKEGVKTGYQSSVSFVIMREKK